jgi:DNA-binding NarL/FixJ family response regulator
MASIAAAPEASAMRTRPTVKVVAGDSLAHRTVARQLSEAGFADCEGDEPATVVVLFAAAREDARLRDIRELAAAQPDAAVLVIVPAGIPNAGLRRVLLAGATGIVLEDDVPRALVPTARALLAGQLSVPTALGRQIAPRPLSHREKQILALVVLGKTNREIAHTLFLAESTVKTHLSSAFRKVDARSRSEAVARIQDRDSGFDLGVAAFADGAAA